MTNLYAILFTHYAPKDSEKGIRELIIAPSDSEVYDYIAKDYWTDYEKDFDPDNEEFPTFKDKMIACKGQMNDSDYSLQDLYYGCTLYGWELIKENISTEEIEVFKRVGILKEGVK